ncbi:MAG: prepilin-type N-terminal cleavage/methylation domain-containing protein [Candidatus Omnitrophica bacterium]|nr:prepilin-type N-terminal cleavage/methylation domain-containing protein [Candidatus Omnitrophota bacterium]
MGKRKGFTLVEIMIVVAILGILASIAFSNIQNYRNRAQKNACIANLRAIDSNISLWAINNGKTGTDTIQMSDLVPQYLKSTPYCPQDSSKQGYVLTTVSQKPACPANPQEHFIN